MIRFILLAAIATVAAISTRASAHIITIDNTFNLVAERDKATGELMVPIEPMLKWSAALEGRAAADKTEDPQAYATAQGAKILESIQLSYDEIEMQGKIVGVSLRTVDLGLAEDSKPQQMAVYSIEFTPRQKIAASPAEVTFGHNLLAVPEQFQEVDVTVMCLVHFRQSDQKTTKSEGLTSDEHVTFKCKWPSMPASNIPARVDQPDASVHPVSRVTWYIAGGAGFIGALACGAVMMKRRAQ